LSLVLMSVFCLLPTVGEDDEVSIKEVADVVVAAVGFEGEYRVRPVRASCPQVLRKRY
jgi:GDP-L-fucose synthase